MSQPDTAADDFHVLTAICKSCRYWLEDRQTGLGHCHRFPPQIVSAEEGVLWLWPLLRPTDYCGEFHVKMHA